MLEPRYCQEALVSIYYHCDQNTHLLFCPTSYLMVLVEATVSQFIFNTTCTIISTFRKQYQH
jgi:hypothetical protein